MVESAQIELDRVASRAQDVARRFLYRWRDPRTRRVADDLAQEAVVLTLRRIGSLGDPSRMPALVRTIVRRLRFRTIVRFADPVQLESELDIDLPEPVVPRAPDPRTVCVRGRWFECERLLPLLQAALARLHPLNERLLREYYAGASCRALAVRHRLSLDTVKVRLHRGRRRVRELMEDQIRALRA